MRHDLEHEVAVIGAGHAGCEAALASARIGADTIILTGNLDTIASMPCSPSIGGPAKGHLVREIDALGGEMGRAIDDTYIHIRMLNTSRGPAVQALRAQADKLAYQRRMRTALEAAPGLTLKQELVERVLPRDDGSFLIITQTGLNIAARAVVIATGTFLNGVVHLGHVSYPAGRMGEFACTSLSGSLSDLGFKLGRLKTGTVPRVDARSLDFSEFERQSPSSQALKFSFLSAPGFPGPQVDCWIAYTNEKTMEVIDDNLDKSALYGGKITGTGARYCPSIEDKAKKFPEKKRHTVFIEPETLNHPEVYLQGLSTSLPESVQLKYLRTIPGMDTVKILRPGYAIEYDFVEPNQLTRELEAKTVARLYFAGQINGTSGYEEAAAQGLIAGANAALALQKKPALILERDQAYIGVMIDDLVSTGVQEPYRIFTSRAEYRLILRHDNADLRLTEIGVRHGMVTRERAQRARNRTEALEKTIAAADKCMWPLPAHTSNDSKARQQQKLPLSRLCKQPAFCLPDEAIAALASQAGISTTDAIAVHETFIYDLRYEGYINKMHAQLDRETRLMRMPFPKSMNFSTISGLSNEARQNLAEICPETLGQAAKMPGVRHGDVMILAYWMQKNHESS